MGQAGDGHPPLTRLRIAKTPASTSVQSRCLLPLQEMYTTYDTASRFHEEAMQILHRAVYRLIRLFSPETP